VRRCGDLGFSIACAVIAPHQLISLLTKIQEQISQRRSALGGSRP
jgi:hypothetical protein